MKIYNNLVEGVTRLNEKDSDSIKAWAKAEENLGLTKSIFILQKNGNLTQYYDYEEGEEFYKRLKAELKAKDYFNYICEKYFEALKDKDLVKIFECLIVFNEIEEHPEIATEDILRRLLRVRESSHNEIYNLS